MLQHRCLQQVNGARERRNRQLRPLSEYGFRRQHHPPKPMTWSAHPANHLHDALAQRHTPPLRRTDTQQGPSTSDRKSPSRPCLCRSGTSGKPEHPHTPNSTQTQPRTSRSCRPTTPASSRHGHRVPRPPGIHPSRSAQGCSYSSPGLILR